MDSNVILILTLLIFAETDFGFTSPTIPQRSLREIANKRRQLNYLKTLLQDLDDKLEKLEKRSCAINFAEMNCDYREIPGSGKDHSYRISKVTPGKKSRYRQGFQFL